MIVSSILKACLTPLCGTGGARAALQRFVQELRAQRRHRHACREAQRLAVFPLGLRIQFGSGPKVKVGWLNIDLFDPKADLRLDVRESMPLPDHCASVIYSEHLLEHLEYPGEVMQFLSECRRLLMPSGRFSVGVPDTRWPLEAYVDGDESYFQLARDRMHPAWCDTRLHHINYHFRQGHEHRYAYDVETLTQVLKQSGFADIQRRAYDAKLDSAERATGTLYMDAYRPAQAQTPRAA